MTKAHRDKPVNFPATSRIQRSISEGFIQGVVEVAGSRNPDERRDLWRLVSTLIGENKAPALLILNSQFGAALRRDEASSNDDVRLAAQGLRDQIKRTFGPLMSGPEA
jgi:hypothetical protein